MSTSGRLWLTRDIVLAAEQVPFGEWPKERMHTVTLHVPKKPSESRKRNHSFGRKKLIVADGVTATKRSTNNSSSSSSHNTNSQSTARSFGRTTHELVPPENIQSINNLGGGGKTESNTTVSDNKSSKLWSTPAVNGNNSNPNVKTSAKRASSKEDSEDRFKKDIKKLHEGTKVTDKKFQRLMEASNERRKNLEVARKGIIVEHSQDHHKLRKDLLNINLQHKRGEKETLDRTQLLHNEKKRVNHQRGGAKRRSERPFQHLMNDEGEGQWRHNLTLLFQNGLKELNFFFDACGRRMDRSHRQEVLATLAEYHKLLHVTFDKIRLLRKENIRTKQLFQKNKATNRRKRNTIQLADNLYLQLKSIEQNCRYLEYSNKKLSIRVKQRENFARSESLKIAKEITTYQMIVSKLQSEINDLISDHENLEARKTKGQSELDRLKLLYKKKPVVYFSNEKTARKTTGN